MEQAQKDALKVQVLTGRVSQLVAQYENQIADTTAEAQLIINELNAEVASLKQQLAAATGGEGEVPAEEAAADADAEQG